MVKDAGPTMPAFTMKIFDTISSMEAKMTETGGLDFEANYEVIFAGLLEEVLEHRLKAFQDLAANHKLSQKASPDGKGGKAFGLNVCLWRLIANGQIFNQRFLHPWSNLEYFYQESAQCNALVDEWINDANNQTTRWGTLTIRNVDDDFPAKCFTFSHHIGFGPAKLKAHPHLHPTRYQSWPRDVTIYVPAKGPLPMVSFCGADGYGLIHPNTINAAVLQCCVASSKESRECRSFPESLRAHNPSKITKNISQGIVIVRISRQAVNPRLLAPSRISPKNFEPFFIVVQCWFLMCHAASCLGMMLDLHLISIRRAARLFHGACRGCGLFPASQRKRATRRESAVHNLLDAQALHVTWET